MTELLPPCRILTYNIFVRPPLINSRSGDEKDIRLNEFIRRMDKFDIICLQEMVSGCCAMTGDLEYTSELIWCTQFGSFTWRRKRLFREARARGFAHCVASEASWWDCLRGKLVDGGLCVLSRHPLDGVGFAEFKNGADLDGLMRKGVLWAVVAKSFVLVTTHLQAIYEGKESALEPPGFPPRARTGPVAYSMRPPMKQPTQFPPAVIGRPATRSAAVGPEEW